MDIPKKSNHCRIFDDQSNICFKSIYSPVASILFNLNKLSEFYCTIPFEYMHIAYYNQL